MSQSCQNCGACCASYRVAFYWSESDAHPCGAVPQRLTIPIAPLYVAMRGTEARPARCVALDGEVGQSVRCTIYALRASTCREFSAASERCNQARVAHGLAPLPAMER